jgi:MoxR-like ATPase
MAQNPIEIARERLREVEKTLNQIVIGHEEMVQALILATVAGEHAIIIGPPGTAKSFAVRTLAKLLNAKFYSYLLTKFTSYDELFGAVDIVTLSKGEFRRKWSELLNADFVFLDEIFKANSAVLNALLSLLQERIVYDPMTGANIEAKLHTAIGASNEVPEDPELMALYDRFAVRVFIDYLNNDEKLYRALEARWVQNTFNDLKPIASMSDVKTLHQHAVNLLRMKVAELETEVYKLFHINVMPMIKKMREKGVVVSDRTIIEKMPKLYAAYIALYGETVENVMGAPYTIVQYLAKSRDEYQAIKKAIEESLGEVGKLASMLENAKTLINSLNFNEARKVLEEILHYDISKLEQTPWLRPRIEAILATAREYLDYIAQVAEGAKRLSRR